MSGWSGTSGATAASGYSGISGWSGTSGVSGWSGTSGVSGWSGTSGVSGWSGTSGTAGPSTTINAADDTTTTTLYPVMVGATGSNQTAKAGNTKGFTYNASTNTLQIVNLTTGSNVTAGTMTGNWSLSTGSQFRATYADLSELYIADAEYAPGTVLEFGGHFEVTCSNTFDSTRVAGVVSTNPAYIMNSDCIGEYITPLVLQGRVPVKVLGSVAKGDLMVSANNGYSMANNNARAGTIIGKSLENFSGISGTIEIVIGKH